MCIIDSGNFIVQLAADSRLEPRRPDLDAVPLP